ncbi:HAD family hydrolase [Sphingomonas bacterium]|uniref:HAD family hydrolase n=1 Tax=Sphingomonas bacterium TaxID=1895847 RepID=UPI0015775371|nr:HAD family hydrolase [Sphingomonas bacterium]
MIGRPLLITDCDEVLLHMVRHFGEWLTQAHAIDFRPVGGQFAEALRHRHNGEVVPPERVWPLLDGFFATEMARQTLVPHAREAIARIAAVADVVILTNLGEHNLAARSGQLAALGIDHRVVCNGHGPKGAAVRALLDEYRPSVAAFVDDLAWHHASVAEAAPHIFRLHMVAEPSIAPDVPPAPAAHARIDDWTQAADWLLARFAGVPLDAAAAPTEGDAHEHR